MTDAEAARLIVDQRGYWQEWLHQRTHNLHDAEDLTSEAVKRVWANREKIDAGARPEAYCWTLVRNVLNASLRGIKRELQWPTAEPESDDELQRFPDPSAERDHESRVLVERMLAALDESDRALLLDYYVRGWKGTELGERHGYAPNWALNRITRSIVPRMLEGAA